jgi:inner membrane transporter RhtA
VALSETAAPPSSLLTRAPSAGLVVGAIASVQFGSALAATLFARIGPGGTVFLRLAFAALILVGIWRPGLRGRTHGELAQVAIFGLVMAGMNLSFYESLHRIPLGIAVALEFVGPLSVALAGSRRRVDLLWVALAAAGILALTRAPSGEHLDGLGIAFALLAGGFWGTYILLNPRLGKVFEGSSGLALAMCFAAVALLPIGIIDGGAHLLDGESLALGAAVGVLSGAIPYSFEVEALRRIPPAVFGVLMSIEPGMAALAGFLVLGQRLGARVLVGIALVIVASVGASRRTHEAPLTG